MDTRFWSGSLGGGGKRAGDSDDEVMVRGSFTAHTLTWGSADWPSGYTLLTQISMSFGIIVVYIRMICYSVVRNKNQNYSYCL